WPTIAEGKPSPHADILHNVTPFNGAIRAGDWKLVLNGYRRDTGDAEPKAAGDEPKQGKKGKKAGEKADDAEIVELFNITADPYEKNDLSAKNPEKVKELRARLDAYAKAAVPPKSAPAAPGYKVPKVW